MAVNSINYVWRGFSHSSEKYENLKFFFWFKVCKDSFLSLCGWYPVSYLLTEAVTVNSPLRTQSRYPKLKAFVNEKAYFFLFNRETLFKLAILNEMICSNYSRVWNLLIEWKLYSKSKTHITHSFTTIKSIISWYFTAILIQTLSAKCQNQQLISGIISVESYFKGLRSWQFIYNTKNNYHTIHDRQFELIRERRTTLQ